MRPAFKLFALAAFLTAILIAVSGPGVRLGLWDYRTGLAILQGLRWSAIALTGAGIIATLVSLRRRDGISFLMLASTFAIACAAYAPVRFDQLASQNPKIHDITTDFENPSAINFAASLPRKNPPRYVGAEKASHSEMSIAQEQRAAFPEIAPIIIDASLESVLQQSVAAINDMNMETLETEMDGETAIIEAVFTSFWFGFSDDFIVRVKSQGGSLKIDVRSKSRVGVADLGANANRIEDFLSRLQPISS